MSKAKHRAKSQRAKHYKKILRLTQKEMEERDRQFERLMWETLDQTVIAAARDKLGSARDKLGLITEAKHV